MPGQGMLSTHPCIVCGSLHQTCAVGLAPLDLADPDTCATVTDDGPLGVYVVDGATFLFSAAEAEARGLT